MRHGQESQAAMAKRLADPQPTDDELVGENMLQLE
jgi:hypothetical protein